MAGEKKRPLRDALNVVRCGDQIKSILMRVLLRKEESNYVFVFCFFFFKFGPFRRCTFVLAFENGEAGRPTVRSGAAVCSACA